MPAMDELEPMVWLEVYFYAINAPGDCLRGTCCESTLNNVKRSYRHFHQIAFAGSAAILVKSYAP
jgi:hypothetical protein